MNNERQVVPLVMSDMDDTLHKAEERVMRDTWNIMLEPWGITWKPTASTNPDNRLVKEEERPGVGIRPLEVLKHFVRTYGLDLANVDELKLHALGLPVEAINQLRANWAQLEPDQRVDELGVLLEGRRKLIPEQIVKDTGVEEIHGAVAMLRRLREGGNAIAVVTSGSLTYAQNVMEGLGIVERDEEGNVIRADYDMLVSGDMVAKAKPDPESLHLTKQILGLVDEAEGKPDVEYRPVAMIGDSGSDVGLAKNAGIPLILLRDTEYMSEGKKAGYKAELGDRLQLIHNWDEVTPEGLIAQLALVEGRMNHGMERM